MHFHAALSFLLLLSLALLVVSAPVNEREEAQLKRALKQYNARQGKAAKRQEIKPSKYAR